MVLLPLTWLYDELLLKAISGVYTTPQLLFSVFFGLSAGLMWASVLGTLRRGRKTYIIIALLNALIFTVESVLRSTYPVYFSPASILAGAGNVAANYREEMIRGIVSGIGRMALFSLPVIFCCAALCTDWIKNRKASDQSVLEAAANAAAGPAPQRKRSLPSAAAIALSMTLSILLHYTAAAFACSGAYRPIYTGQYNFNDAVENFGLTTALRLETCYSIFGNPGSSFQLEEDADEGVERKAAEEGADPDPAAASDAAGPGSDSDEAAPGMYDATPSDMVAEAETPEEAAEELPPPPSYNVMDIDFGRPELSEGSAGELSAFLSTREPSLQNEYTGIFRGKNLIMICAESYCDAFVRPELTPTLWRLSRNGFYFSDFYQPSWGGSTTTGELSFVEGLDSTAGDEAVTNIADHNHYFSMGNQLQRLGYFSLAFHNGSYTFYHRERTHENLGYDAYFASGHHIEDFCGQGYPTDTQMIEGTLPAYIGHQPFSIYYMTVSGHAPYEKNSYFVRHYYDQVNAIVGDEYYEKTKYYICYQMELESALTSLVKGLEDAGIADDTVIVLVGDHYPYGLGNGRTWHNDRDYIDDLIKEDDVLYWNEDKNGLIIWSGCLENSLKGMSCEISEPVSSLDILPTVSNLFGVEFDSRLLPGRDVFAENTEPFVFWNNLSWITKDGKYDSRKKVFYPAETAATAADYAPEPEPVDLDYAHRLTQNMITMCTRIEALDYYGLVFGPDTVKGDPEAVWALLEQELQERAAEAQAEAEAAAQAAEEAVQSEAEETSAAEVLEAGETAENSETPETAEDPALTESAADEIPAAEDES